MAGEIPVTNIINVTLTGTQSGLREPNVNSLAIFTNEQPANPGVYGAFGTYVSPSQVAADYGTASVTAQMANAIFSQTPNIRSGRGRLVVIPMISAVSATAGKFTTPDISANVANFSSVTAGDLRITANGTVYNLTGLNFTGVTTVAGIAKVIDNAIPAANVTAVGNTIVATSKRVGTASTIVLAAVTGGTGTNIFGATYLNGGTAVGGVASSGETLPAAVARTQASVQFVGVLSAMNFDDTVVLANSAALNAQDMIYFQHGGDAADVTGLALAVKNAGYKKTRILVKTDGQAAANLFKAAYAGRAMSVNFTGSNTAQTMNLKGLIGIAPDQGLNQTLYDQAALNGADLYASIDGVPSVISNGADDFYDNVYSDIALKFALQTAGFNYLRRTNTKVPQTETGMTGLKSAYAVVLQAYVNNGSLAPGEWNSAETFGDPETFKENIRSRGFYLYSEPVARQSTSDRDGRIAPLIQGAVKRAGAIHHSDVIINVNN